MTDQTTTEATDEPQETPVETPEAPTQDTEQDTGKAAKEAKRYRLQLRDTEAERDQLRERVDALQRREAETIAGSVLRNGAGLWAAGASVADLLDDNGNIDRDAVLQHARDAAATIGLQTNSPKPDPTIGGHGDVGVSDHQRWTQAMRPQ